jgi:AcrR family transcriptional regulator
MRLADQGGLGELSMRRLASALGVEAMSLYHHVPNKDAILNGMVDLVFEEIELPPRDVDWKTALRRRMTSMREVLVRHRWALQILESRRTPGAATLAHHDAVLGCLRQAGFSITLAAHAYAVLDSYVFGFVHTELALPFQGPDETREVAGAIVEGIPAGMYPHLVELATTRVLVPGYAYANEFPFGLELILDGLERALAQNEPG